MKAPKPTDGRASGGSRLFRCLSEARSNRAVRSPSGYPWRSRAQRLREGVDAVTREPARSRAWVIGCAGCPLGMRHRHRQSVRVASKAGASSGSPSSARRLAAAPQGAAHHLL
jgi:hypothetical protein